MTLNKLQEEVLNSQGIDTEEPSNKSGVFRFISGIINLKKFDFFGVSFDFRLENHHKYVSKTGGLWFLIYLLICLVYSVLSIRQFILDPEFTTSAYFRNLHFRPFNESIIINKENFSFSFIPPKMPNYTDFFEIECAYNLLLREDEITQDREETYKMFNKIKFDNVTLNKNNTKGQADKILIKNLKRIKCNVSDFFYSTKQNMTFENYGLKEDDLYCFEQSNDFVLAGNLFNKYYSFFKIKVKLNKKYEALRGLLKSAQFEKQFRLIYSELYADYDDFEYFEKIAEELKDFVDDNYRKNIDVFIQRTSFNSDKNWFWNSGEKIYYSKVLRSSVRNYPINKSEKDFYSNSESLVEISFMPVNDYPKLRRKRDKFWGLASNISTFTLKNFLIMKMIFLYLNTQKAKNFIINEFLSVENHPSKKNNKHFFELSEKVKENILLRHMSYNVSNKNAQLRQSDNLDVVINKNSFNPQNIKDKVRKNQSHIYNFERSGNLKSSKNLFKLSIKNIFDDTVSNFSKKEEKLLNSNFATNFNKAKNNNLKDKTKSININDNIELSLYQHDICKNKDELFISKDYTKNSLGINETYTLDVNNTDTLKNFIDESIKENFTESNQRVINEAKENIIKETPIGESKIQKSLLKKPTYESTKLSIRRFIKHFFCCEWGEILKEKRYINLSERKFDIFINIKNLMRKSTEIDVLKYLILDEDMLYLNNYISRSLVFQKEPIDKNICYNNLDKYFQREQMSSSDITSLDYEMMKVSYCNLKNKIHKGDADNRIIDLFEHQFENMTCKKE